LVVGNQAPDEMVRLLGDTANKVWTAVELVYPIKVP
jgi:hypothetical protein